MRGWVTEGRTCTVVRRDPRVNLALLTVDRPTPTRAVVASLRDDPPKIGEAVYTIGYPHQIPAFLSRGHVGAVLERLKIDNMPSDFATPIFVTTGAYTQGSAGSGVFDAAGRCVGIVFADLYKMDGSAAIASADIRAWLATNKSGR